MSDAAKEDASPSAGAVRSRIVGLLPLAVLLVSCGGGLSKADFIERADQICSDAQERAQDLPQPTDPRSADDYARALEEITKSYISELRDLEPPDEDVERVEQLIDAVEQAGLKVVEAIRLNSSGGNPARLSAEALHLAEEANEQAERYGFSSCGISEGLAPH